MIDLVGEVLVGHWNMRRQHEDKLAALGVSFVTVYGEDRLWGHFGVIRAQFHGDLYEPNPAGQGVFVLGVMEQRKGPIIDLLAFHPDRPDRWWLRLGSAVLLGRYNARLAQLKEEPLFVHPDPLSWLRADCMGAVVLDWDADLILYLDGGGILAADHRTASRIEKSFRRSIRVPQVRVMGERKNAA